MLPFVGAALVVTAMLLAYLQAAAQTAALASGPTVSGITENSALISFSASAPAYLRMAYGSAPDALGDELRNVDVLGTGEEIASASTSFYLGPLAAGTTYYYRVRILAESGAEQYRSEVRSFTTLAPAYAGPVLSGVAVRFEVSETADGHKGTLTVTTDGDAESVRAFVMPEGGTAQELTPSSSGSRTYVAGPVPLAPGIWRGYASATGKDANGGPVTFNSAIARVEVEERSAQTAAEDEEDVAVTAPTRVEVEDEVAEAEAPAAQEVEDDAVEPRDEAIVATGETESSEDDMVADAEEEGETIEPEPARQSPVMFVGGDDAGDDTEEGTDAVRETFSVGVHLFGADEGAEGISEELEQEIGDYIEHVGGDPRGALLGGMVGGTDVRSHGEALCEKNFIRPESCIGWLAGEFSDPSCRDAGILTKSACVEYLTVRNDGEFPGCETLNDDDCDELKALVTIDLLQDDVFEDVERIIERAGAEKVLVALPELTSLKPELLGEARWWGSPRAEGQQTSRGMVVIDADLDGLPDDYERDIGTSADAADTDEDGIADAEELRTGTDPLGAGELGRELRASERTVVFSRPLEQPSARSDADPSFKVGVGAPGDAYEKEADAVATRLVGTCDPGETCIIYIYSYVPMVLTTTADAAGNFTYDLSDSLTDGQHTVYVAVTDDTGRIVKRSAPLSFFVNEAQAVTFDEFAAAAAQPLDAAMDVSPEQAQRRFLWGAFVIVVLGAVLAVAILRTPRREGAGME